MKKRIMLAAFFLAACGLASAADKIGLVNSNLVLQNSVKGKEVIARLEAARSASQKKLEALQNEIDALQKDLAGTNLTVDVRQRKTMDMQTKRTTLARQVEDARNDWAQKRQKEFEALQKDIMPILEKIAKDEGYTVIFDVTNAGIAYANPGADITVKVIQAFDAKIQSVPKAK